MEHLLNRPQSLNLLPQGRFPGGRSHRETSQRPCRCPCEGEEKCHATVNHETRGTEKVTQGPRTREQQKAVIEGREKTRGAAVDPHQKSLAEAREDMERPAGEYEISHGDRSIQRGANQESEHHKRRAH